MPQAELSASVLNVSHATNTVSENYISEMHSEGISQLKFIMNAKSFSQRRHFGFS